MLKKRLVGVVTVKNGWAVQSFGYHRYLPLGNPECLVENLDRWGADEILVQVIDRSASDSSPCFELVERLGGLGLETPLIYAGGIRSAEDGVKLVQLGADRIVVDSLLHDDLSQVRALSEMLGAQALIASMPVSWNGDQVEWYDYRTRTAAKITDELLDTFHSNLISEVLVTDWMHEGYREGFEQRLVDEFPVHHVPVIAFGGVTASTQMRVLLQMPMVVAVAVGNALSYEEHTIQKHKEALAGMPVRHAIYEHGGEVLADV